MELNSQSTVIIGSGGQLGLALQAALPLARALSREKYVLGKTTDFDFSDVQVVVNAAAFTAVDQAESMEGRVAAWQSNAVGVGALVRQLAGTSAVLVHVSSDYVFDGTKQGAYSESDPICPLSVYGQTKAAGDIVVGAYEKHYILRTSWVIGQGKNFVKTMLAVAEKGINPTVVSDQVGRLTFTKDLTAGIVFLVSGRYPFGTYNFTNGGDPVSWADVAREIFKQKGLSNQVIDTTTEAYFTNKPEAAKRPKNSVFDLSKLTATGFTPRTWQEALREYLEII